MGLQSALTTSLTGLQAAETTISVVGNNVANANTVGFKASDTLFATQFLQTITIGSAPGAGGGGSGGTNPQQIGLGVQVAAITPDFSQGTIEISSNPLDLAIQGDGFLQVLGLQGETLFTRNGQLALNSQNELTTVGGQRVLGFDVNDEFEIQPTTRPVPLTIPLGADQVAQETQNATFAGTLNPLADLAAVPSISQSVVLSDGLIAQPDVTAFDANTFFASEIPVAGSAAAGAATAPGTGPGGGDYSYRVAFVDAFGNESAFSEVFTVPGVAADTSIDLSSLPPADNANYTDRVLYRTVAGGNDFFRLDSIGDATTSTYTDTIPDSALGNAIDDDNIEPGTYNYFITYFDPSTGDETPPTTQITGASFDDIGGNRIRIDLSDLGTPPAGFDQIRVYRQVDGTQEFRRLPTALPITAPANAIVDSFSNAEIANEPLVNLDGPPADDETLLVDLRRRDDPTLAIFQNVFEEGTLTFNAEAAGVELGSQQFEITDTTTVGNLLAFIQGALGIDTSSDVVGEGFPSDDPNSNISPPGVRITSDGRIEVTSNLGEENAIEIPLTAFSLQPVNSDIPQQVVLNFSETQPANGPGTSTELTVFDSLGAPINVRITTVLESRTGSSTTYRYFATTPDNEPISGNTTVVGDGILIFNQNGELDENSPATQIAIQRTDTASLSPLLVNLDFSGVTSLAQTNAAGNPTSNLNFTSQDGFPPGVLTDFIITDDGTIQGQFSNGVQRPLGQIVLARFANNQGLQAVGDNLFTVSVNSGPAITDVPGENGLGTLSAGAVELSNTDIGQNLIELILASTQYRGGSRVITSTQELIDELLALV